MVQTNQLAQRVDFRAPKTYFSDEWSQKYKSSTVVAMDSESSSEEGDFFGALYRSQMGSMAKGPPDELTKYLAEPIVSTDSMKSTGLLGWWKVV